MEDAAIRFIDQTGHPRFHRPCGIEFFLCEKLEHVRVGRGDDAGISAHKRDFDSLLEQPSPAFDILGISKLGGGDGFSSEVIHRGDRIAAHDERLAAAHGAGHDANFLAVGSGVGVHDRTWSDISHVDCFGKESLHRRRASIVNRPLQLDGFPKAGFKPAIAFARHV